MNLWALQSCLLRFWSTSLREFFHKSKISWKSIISNSPWGIFMEIFTKPEFPWLNFSFTIFSFQGLSRLKTSSEFKVSQKHQSVVLIVYENISDLSSLTSPPNGERKLRQHKKWNFYFRFLGLSRQANNTPCTSESTLREKSAGFSWCIDDSVSCRT